MYEDEELPECLEWYKDQIAGHHPSVVKNGIRQIGIVKEHGRDAFLLKLVQEGERGTSEVQFYDGIFETNETDHTEPQKIALVQLRKFVPRYFGRRTIEIAKRSYEFIELEDITNAFSKPCIMDIKIGKVTYDPMASEAKRLAESIKSPFQTDFGFRILGYKLHPTETGLTREKDKNWGRTRSPGNIKNAFLEYLEAIPRNPKAWPIVLRTFVHELTLMSNWFATQNSIQLYSSSLLFVYEGDATRPPAATVKMIDFSHVFYDTKRDDNYIHGLSYIKKMFSRIESENRQ
uniref:Kinase n=1 Tax=Panagrellus redivivus TaxID=6233 RepID=A0A7E4ZZQ7_PANRE